MFKTTLSMFNMWSWNNNFHIQDWLFIYSQVFLKKFQKIGIAKGGILLIPNQKQEEEESKQIFLLKQNSCITW